MMKAWIALGLVSLSLGGCSKSAGAAFGGLGAHGRYQGVGIYSAGQMWAQVAGRDAPKDSAAAQPADDEQIIVVMDTNTGELRQCGNLSGRCIGMNPWAKPLPASQIAPALVAKHADQLSIEIESKARSAAPAP
jgi:hypothetical protein